MITIYGIPNCDTIKKARRWLEQQGVEYTFHDYRKNGLDKEWLQQRTEDLGWEQLVNRRGTTWRKLPEEIRNSMNSTSAVEAMLEQPGMIKRPLLHHNTGWLLGFSVEQWQQALGQHALGQQALGQKESS